MHSHAAKCTCEHSTPQHAANAALSFHPALPSRALPSLCGPPLTCCQSHNTATHHTQRQGQQRRGATHTHEARQARQDTRWRIANTCTQAFASGGTPYTHAHATKCTCEHSTPKQAATVPFQFTLRSPRAPLLSVAQHLLSAGRTTPPRNTRSATASQTPRGHTHTRGTPGTSEHSLAHRQHTHTHTFASGGTPHTHAHAAKRRARALDAQTSRHSSLSVHLALLSRTIPSIRDPALTFCWSYNTSPQHTQRHGKPNAAGPHTHKRHARHVRTHGGAAPTHTHAFASGGTPYTRRPFSPPCAPLTHPSFRGPALTCCRSSVMTSLMTRLPRLPPSLPPCLPSRLRNYSHFHPRCYRSYNTTPQHTQRHGKPNAAWPHTHKARQARQGTRWHITNKHTHTRTRSQAGAHRKHLRLHAKWQLRALDATTRRRGAHSVSPLQSPLAPFPLFVAQHLRSAGRTTTPRITRSATASQTPRGHTHTRGTPGTSGHTVAHLQHTHTHTFASGGTPHTHAHATKRSARALDAQTSRRSSFSAFPTQCSPRAPSPLFVALHLLSADRTTPPRNTRSATASQTPRGHTHTRGTPGTHGGASPTQTHTHSQAGAHHTACARRKKAITSTRRFNTP
jgi:hypothetical protein